MSALTILAARMMAQRAGRVRRRRALVEWLAAFEDSFVGGKGSSGAEIRKELQREFARQCWLMDMYLVPAAGHA